ncbi:MAG: hypothetical protein PHF84_07675, partial [bacterium]|nr:hypothetical protein [bacterium]
NLARLIAHCRQEDYSFIFIPDDFPAHMKAVIREELGQKVHDLSSIGGILRFHPDFYQEFRPNFKCRIFGTRQFPLKTASFYFYGCSYSGPIRNNPVFQACHHVPLLKWRGCSYCPSALSGKKISCARLGHLLKKQMDYLRKGLPSLRIIEVPSPFTRDFIRAFTGLLKRSSLRSLSFLVFFRPDDMVKNRIEMEDLLRLMKRKGCSFLVENIGFENFSGKELLLLNRGYGPEMNGEALKTFFYFKKKYPDTWITRNTSASFILFGPFTTVQDLKANITGILKLKRYFSAFYRISFNKLRIQKNTPVYYLCRKAGLLNQKSVSPDYRFRDTRVRRIHENFLKLMGTIPPQDHDMRILSFLFKSIKRND